MSFRLLALPCMVHAILRFYSYIFQFLISLAALGLGLVALLSDNTTFNIEMLPWSGTELRNWLLGMGLFGLVSIVLAFKGKLRVLFVLWAVATTFLLGRGIFASGHQFDGDADFKWALLLLAGVALTVFGAVSRMRQPLGR